MVEQVFDAGIETQATVGEGLPAGIGVGDDIAGAVFGHVQRFVIRGRCSDPPAQGQAAVREMPATINEQAGRGERAERGAGGDVLAVNPGQGSVEREGAFTQAQLDFIALQLCRSDIAALRGAGRAGSEEGRGEAGRIEGEVDEEIDQIVGLGLIPGGADIEPVEIGTPRPDSAASRFPVSRSLPAEDPDWQ